MARRDALDVLEDFILQEFNASVDIRRLGYAVGAIELEVVNEAGMLTACTLYADTVRVFSSGSRIGTHRDLTGKETVMVPISIHAHFRNGVELSIQASIDHYSVWDVVGWASVECALFVGGRMDLPLLYSILEAADIGTGTGVLSLAPGPPEIWVRDIPRLLQALKALEVGAH